MYLWGTETPIRLPACDDPARVVLTCRPTTPLRHRLHLRGPRRGIGRSSPPRTCASSPWILTHPHRGLSLAIRQMSSWSSGSIGGRPVRFAR